VAQTGVLVVCPAALNGADGNACWKAFPNYGYCFSNSPESSEDVNFLEALIQSLKTQYAIPADKVVMSGFSNGGSMAYRFMCEKSELISGLVVGGQAWFDPWVGYYDYQNQTILTGTPQCNPTRKVPFYGVIGTQDEYYGDCAVVPGFKMRENWGAMSTEILGCTASSNRTVTTRLPSFPQGAASCEEYTCPSVIAPSLNRLCSVTGMGHDSSAMQVILPLAFTAITGVPLRPTGPQGQHGKGNGGSPTPAPPPSGHRVTGTLTLSGVDASSLTTNDRENLKSVVANAVGSVCGPNGNGPCTASDVTITIARRSATVSYSVNVYTADAATSGAATINTVTMSEMTTNIAANGGALAVVTVSSKSTATGEYSPPSAASSSNSRVAIIIAIVAGGGALVFCLVVALFFSCCKRTNAAGGDPSGMATGMGPVGGGDQIFGIQKQDSDQFQQL